MSAGLFSRFLPLPLAELVPDVTPANKDGSSHTRPSAVLRALLRESDVLAALDRVAPLPTVAQKILALVDSQTASTADLEQLVRLDPVIAAKLLKLVNSPFYGLPNHVSSVAQAVTMIGFAGVKSLVVAASLSDVLAQDCSGYGFSVRGMWKSAISGAAIARTIAQQAGVANDECEEYFLAALMRDIGILALGPFLAKRGQRLVRDREPDVQARERAALGFDHCWVGERLGERWRLPPRLRLALARHHRLTPDLIEEDARLVAGVHLADSLASASRIGLLADHPFDVRVDPPLIQAAGLDGASFQALIQRLPSVILAAETQV
jgi:HD-like signal output (HDOD) protein